MKIRTSHRGLRTAIAGAAALALTLGTAGTASAQTPLPVLGDPQEFLNTALTQKEGCAYPGILVPVIAQISREAVLGCGYFETDPAFPGNQPAS